MKFLSIFLLGLILNVASFAGSFPTSPHPGLTPGSVCAKTQKTRYKEQIRYCERDVKAETKIKIIQTYDLELGYSISKMNRGDFKIDHYIPLCAGGSNEVDNLWPQHRSVFELTDQLEGELCVHMALGLMLQEEAIKLITYFKDFPDRAPDEFKRLQDLRLRTH